ncbi:hypothetical protein [Haloarcula litorea]|uniref:hypothetical protein n=1 Tax=Haloarcula litorea TaxID=3032579 RepID=UPI0023E7BB71|nr:hypothetical protein [Halomicroarcula sp. GDY20]
MATDTRKVMLGALLLLVSTVLILGPLGLPVPTVAAGVAALGLAAGALLVGTSEDGRPV